MFHLDAGWFRDVGDWHADPKKFPHGIANRSRALPSTSATRPCRHGRRASWSASCTTTHLDMLEHDGYLVAQAQLWSTVYLAIPDPGLRSTGISVAKSASRPK
jgi:hypothetical protein